MDSRSYPGHSEKGLTSRQSLIAGVITLTLALGMLLWLFASRGTVVEIAADLMLAAGSAGFVIFDRIVYGKIGFTTKLVCIAGALNLIAGFIEILRFLAR